MNEQGELYIEILLTETLLYRTITMDIMDTTTISCAEY